MPNLAVPWPAKDPIADTDYYFGSDAAGNYWRAKADNVHKQILRRFHPLRPSGTWSPGDVTGQLSASNTITTGKTWFAPFRKFRPEIIDRIGSEQSAGTTGNVAWAIYGSNNATARPTGTSPLAYTGSIAVPNTGVGGDCTGAFSGGTGLSGGNFPFDLGIYWFAVQTSASLGFIRNCPFTANGSLMAWIFGGDTLDEIEGSLSSGSYNGVNCPSTFGTWPDATNATWTKTVGSDASRFVTPFWRIA